MVKKFTQDELDETLNALYYYRDDASIEEDGTVGLKAESKEYKVITDMIEKLENYASIYSIRK